jgi:hypothetical protein
MNESNLECQYSIRVQRAELRIPFPGAPVGMHLRKPMFGSLVVPILLTTNILALLTTVISDDHKHHIVSIFLL